MEEKNEITITNEKERLSTKEIKRMIQEAEYYKAEDKKFLRKAKAMNDLDYYVYKIKNALKKKDISSKLCSKEKENVSSAIARATDLLEDNNQQDDIVVFEDNLKELESIIERMKAMGKIG